MGIVIHCPYMGMGEKETFEEFRDRIDAGAAAHEGRDPLADLYEAKQKHDDAAEQVAKEISYAHSLSEFMDTARQALARERGKHEELRSEEMIDLLDDLLTDLGARRNEAEQRSERAAEESKELSRRIDELNKKASGAA